MPAKQRVAPRAPRQARAREKVELILEAALRLLERKGLDSLTTNALAAAAGVSIGTLYQYFSDKEAVLSALADREVAAFSLNVVTSLQAPGAVAPQQRIRAMIRAVLDAYGGRQRAHRLLMMHAMSRGPSGRLAPMFAQLHAFLTGQGPAVSGPSPKGLSSADAFVLMHAVTAVLRTLVVYEDPVPSREELEESLTKLILRFVQPSA